MASPFSSSSTFASLLVLGGARSGKSHYVQALAEQAARHPHLIATAEAKDDEMRDRISVSYTHLDVYKRQATAMQMSPFARALICSEE